MTGSYDINIFNMLKNREEAVKQINTLFGTSISVKLNDRIYYEGSVNATLGENVEEEEEIKTEEENENVEENV